MTALKYQLSALGTDALVAIFFKFRAFDALIDAFGERNACSCFFELLFTSDSDVTNPAIHRLLQVVCLGRSCTMASHAVFGMFLLHKPVNLIYETKQLWNYASRVCITDSVKCDVLREVVLAVTRYIPQSEDYLSVVKTANLRFIASQLHNKHLSEADWRRIVTNAVVELITWKRFCNLAECSNDAKPMIDIVNENAEREASLYRQRLKNDSLDTPLLIHHVLGNVDSVLSVNPRLYYHRNAAEAVHQLLLAARYYKLQWSCFKLYFKYYLRHIDVHSQDDTSTQACDIITLARHFTHAMFRVQYMPKSYFEKRGNEHLFEKISKFPHVVF